MCDNKFPGLVASLFSWRCLAASTSHFLHAAMNIRPPSVTVSTHASILYPIFFASHTCLPSVVVVVDDDDGSHIQPIVLATEETAVIQQVSHRSLNSNPARGHKEVRRSTGHIMVTTRYSDQQESKWRQNSCQVQPTSSSSCDKMETFIIWSMGNLKKQRPLLEHCWPCAGGL